MSEQASALASGLDGLADLLSDTPNEEPEDEDLPETADDPTDDIDTGEDANDGQDDPDDESGEEDAKPAPIEKIAVTIKADDGTEVTEEVPVEELVKGYQRQADYTKKTQALAERETQAVEFLKAKHDEIRNQYLQQAESARIAVAQMAGLKTEAELAQLAQQDPAAWVAEVQRQKQIGAFLNGLDQQLMSERQRAAQEQQQRQQLTLQQQYQQAWSKLQEEKIDKPTLAKIYGNVNKTYGFSEQELSSVYDYRLVKMMRDATAYQELKAQKGQVTKKVAEAPRMPAKQAPAPDVRHKKALAQKFASGRAKLNDLAAYLN